MILLIVRLDKERIAMCIRLKIYLQVKLLH